VLRRFARRSRVSPLAIVLACSPPPEPVARASVGAAAPRVEVRAEVPLAVEPASTRPLVFGVELVAVDPDMPPLLTPSGRWRPGGGSDVLFDAPFALVDEDALWLDLDGAALRISRGGVRRRVRVVTGCAGWLFGERDDLLLCAEQRGETIEITAIDKTGFGPPSPVATLPFAEALQSSLHPRLEKQGPLVVGDRVVLATATGFVSAALAGDGALELFELGHEPRCVAVGGQRLAWRTEPDGTLWSAELPPATLRREYAGPELVGCPAWAGDSLLFRVGGEATELRRMAADGRTRVLERVPPSGLDVLVGDGERAWWLVRDRGLWWIDAASHGAVDAGGIVPFEATAAGGLFAWWSVDEQGRSIRVGEPIAEPRGAPAAAVDLRVE
jgi:hypothetical protein